MLAQGRLHALAVQHLPFDFGGLQGLVADELDPEAVLIVGADMLESADKLPRTQQKVLLQIR